MAAKKVSRKGEFGTKNLVDMTKRGKDEVKRLQALGGVRSGETRRKQKTMREIMKAIAGNLVDAKKLPKAVVAAADMLGVSVDEMTVKDMVAVLAAIQAGGNKDFYDRFLKAIGEDDSIVQDNITVKINIDGAEVVDDADSKH